MSKKLASWSHTLFLNCFETLGNTYFRQYNVITISFRGLLNYVPYVLSCLTCSLTSRALCLTCSAASRVSWLTCLVPYVLLCLKWLMLCMFSYLACSCFSYALCSTCSCTSRAFMPYVLIMHCALRLARVNITSLFRNFRYFITSVLLFICVCVVMETISCSSCFRKIWALCVSWMYLNWSYNLCDLSGA